MPRTSNGFAFCVIASAVALGALLAGCSDIYYDRRDTIALSAGNAIATNQVTHMVDPWPRNSANRNISFDGSKMQSAVERYRTNKVIPPTNATTSSAAYQAAQQSANAASNSAPPPPPPPAPVK
jgi:hypothetical protein